MATPKKRKPIKRGSKVTKDLTTNMNLMVMPNTKEEKISQKCFFLVEGKRVEAPAYKEQNFDIEKLDALKSIPVKKLFTTLQQSMDLPKGQYAIRNQYGICLGIVEKRASYKAIVAHHQENGDNAVIVNAGNTFTMPTALALAKKHDITLLIRKNNWAQFNMTEDNLNRSIDFVAELLNMSPLKN